MHLNRRLGEARQSARARWNKASYYDRVVLLLAIFYVTLTGAFFVWRHNFISPDQFFFLALIAAALTGRTKTFLWDWVPLVALLLGYEYVRNLVPVINSAVYFRPMIAFDRFFFGTVPTLAMQARYYTEGELHWYDYAAVAMYLLHFIVPLSVAFLFWLQDRKIFKEYAAAILILSYLAYFTYLTFPAAPPWLAAQVGLLPNVNRILAVTFRALSDPISLPTIYSKLGVNTVAAVPSLHAAYPLLTALFVCEKMPKLLPLMAVYVIGVWMAVIYLGEHYVFDVFMGVIYTGLTYALVIYWPAVKKKFAPVRAGKALPDRME